MADRVVPMLASRDLEKSWKFWRYFGFEKIWPPGDELKDAWNLRLRRGEIDLYFNRTENDYTSEEHLPASKACHVLVHDFESWRAAFERSRMNWKMFYPRLGPVDEHVWGTPAFAVVDRDANLVWIVADRVGLDEVPEED